MVIKTSRRFSRKYLYTILAVVTHMIVHESVHIIQALIYGVYKGIKVLPIGIEVEIIQPPTIGGLKLASFSGLSSIVTILTGYILFLFSPKVLKLKKTIYKKLCVLCNFFLSVT
jgi:hypothetical protein